jgi:hypothetical protein
VSWLERNVKVEVQRGVKTPLAVVQLSPDHSKMRRTVHGAVSRVQPPQIVLKRQTLGALLSSQRNSRAVHLIAQEVYFDTNKFHLDV